MIIESFVPQLLFFMARGQRTVDFASKGDGLSATANGARTVLSGMKVDNAAFGGCGWVTENAHKGAVHLAKGIENKAGTGKLADIAGKITKSTTDDAIKFISKAGLVTNVAYGAACSVDEAKKLKERGWDTDAAIGATVTANAAAIGGMYAAEEGYTRGLKKVAEKAPEILPKFKKVGEALMKAKVGGSTGAILKGLGFFAVSMAGYAAGKGIINNVTGAGKDLKSSPLPEQLLAAKAHLPKEAFEYYKRAYQTKGVMA